jgi:hypothetical protein
MRPAPPSWGRWFSPRAFWSQVAPQATQTVLRRWFTHWGLPERLRVDTGTPWGSRGDLPTDLVCWLAGLGVAVVANPPRRPQANGVIERFQGVGQSWAEPGRCASAAELPAHLEWLDRLQRECSPAIAGRSRWEAYPALKPSGRVYDPAQEAATWDLRRVWELLGAQVVPRRVDAQGEVALYNRPYRVGLLWAGRTIWVGFDPEAGSWTFQDERGYELRRQAAELSAERIQALEVTHRRRGCHAAKPPGRSKAAKPRAPTRADQPTER